MQVQLCYREMTKKIEKENRLRNLEQAGVCILSFELRTELATLENRLDELHNMLAELLETPQTNRAPVHRSFIPTLAATYAEHEDVSTCHTFSCV